MAVDVDFWNKHFLKSYLHTGKPVNLATEYGVGIEPVDDPGGRCYVAIGVYHLSGKENGGNHHAYVDVIDSDGNRLWDTVVGVYQTGVGQFFARIDKPATEPGTNHVLNLNVSSNSIFVSKAGYQSERVTGLKSDHKDEEPGNTRGHHSFYIVFLRLDSPLDIPKPAPDPQPDPQPKPPPAGYDEVMLALHDLLQLILQNQAAQSLALKRIEDMLTRRALNPVAVEMLTTELKRVVENFEKLVSPGE